MYRCMYLYVSNKHSVDTDTRQMLSGCYWRSSFTVQYWDENESSKLSTSSITSLRQWNPGQFLDEALNCQALGPLRLVWYSCLDYFFSDRNLPLFLTISACAFPTRSSKSDLISAVLRTRFQIWETNPLPPGPVDTFTKHWIAWF